MSEYVNNSNTNISHGIHAPVVNYQQIPVPHQPQPRPMTDPGGKLDLATTASTLLKGMDTAKKETNDRAKNEYALEVRRLTAAVQQGNLTPTSYETAIRAAGDRAIASGLSSEDVATIESKHSFGYLSTAQKERDQRMKDTLEWDKKAVESFTQNSPMFSLNNDYDGANKTLAGFRASKQTADTFLQQYMATGNENFKPYAVRSMSDLWVKNFNLTLGNMMAQGKEPTQADIARIQADTTHKMVVAGYPKDFVDEAVSVAMNSSDLKMYADTEATTRAFTRKQLEDINKIKLESTAAVVYERYPEWAVFKSIDVEREVAVGVLKDIPIKEQDALYKNFQDLITNGAAISRYVTQTKQGASLPYKIINNTISNPAAVTPTTNVNLIKGSLDTILRDNAEAIASKDPKQIETAGKNLSNISTKAVRSNLEKQLKSDDPNTARQAQLALDALDGVEDAKLVSQLKLTHNSPWKVLESSTANDRLYVDEFTGELKLREPSGVIQGAANVFYGKEFEDALKEVNKIINKAAGGDVERMNGIYEKYFGLGPTSNLQERDTSGLYRNGEEGYGYPGYRGMGMNIQNLQNNKPTTATATATISNSETIGDADVDLSETADLSIWKDVEEYQAAQEQRTFDAEMNTLGAAMEQIESAGNPDAVSEKGARGLMQLMPDTYKDIAKRYGLPEDGIDDPEINRTAGKIYMQELRERYGNDITKTVAAYNMGPTALDKVISKYPNTWEKHLPKETENHIKKFYRALNKLTATASIENTDTIAGASVVSRRDLARARVKEAADRNRPAEESEDVKQLRQQLDIDERKSDLQKLIEKVNDEKLIEAIREFIDRNGTDVE